MDSTPTGSTTTDQSKTIRVDMEVMAMKEYFKMSKSVASPSEIV